jgi:hypothetical protein
MREPPQKSKIVFFIAIFLASKDGVAEVSVQAPKAAFIVS